MNTGEIEIEIGGKKRLLKFGINQSAIFCKLTGKSLGDAFKYSEFTSGDLRDLIYSGLMDGCRVTKEKPDFDNLQVGDWMDSMASSDYETIFNASMGQMPEKKTEGNPEPNQ